MTTEQTGVANTSEPTLQTIYVNMFFDKIAKDVDAKNTQLVPTFNGEGRSLVKLLPSQEPTFLFYSKKKDGTGPLKSPFDFNNNDKVKFILQAAPTDSNKATSKWVDINQSYDNLQLASGELDCPNTAIYKIVLPKVLEQKDVQGNAFTITINFTLEKKKFSISWDPMVVVKK